MNDRDEEGTGEHVTRIAVIGNSNSVMRDSFASILHLFEDFSVENLSIGATPNVVLLDVLATVTDLRHDFIVVETAVVDALQGPSGAYPANVAYRNLCIFVEEISAHSCSKLIFLIIPTRIALLEPKNHRIEELYISVARKYGIPVLNLYNLFRKMIGGYSVDRIERLSAWSPLIAESFEIPRHTIYDLSWVALRKSRLPSNSLAMVGYTDHAHISRPLHRLVGELLAGWIKRSSASSEVRQQEFATVAVIACAPEAANGAWITRQSSLIRRDLLSLSSDQMATYRCPPGYIAAGLFLNRSQTSGFIRLESGIGAVSLDCRFIPHPLSWVGIVVPIMDPIGDGEIRLTVSPHLECNKIQRVPDTHDDANAKGVAEVAEIVLIKRLFEADLEHEYGEPTRHGGYTSIEELPWAEAICRDAYQATDSMIDGIGEIGFGSKGLLHTLLDLVRTKGIGTEAWERARTLLLIGSHCSALEVLSQSISDGNQDPALLERHQRLSSFLAACNESLK